MVPVKVEGRDLIVATSDPFELSRLHALEVATGLRVKAVLAKEKEISARIEALFGSTTTSDNTKAPSAAKSKARWTKRMLLICATWHQKCR